MSGAPGTHAARASATLSVDLDDLWSYLRAAGDPHWREYPGFLDLAIPRLRALLDGLGLRGTFFVVGRDATAGAGAAAIATLSGDGHELASHSFDHAPDFHRLDLAAVTAQLAATEEALQALGAPRPRGFRAPSFRVSATVIEALIARGYHYDASTFPNLAGGLARAWQRRAFHLDAAAARALDGQYGGLAGAWGPLAPHRLRAAAGSLLEFPVSTMPLLRLPVHWTYVHHLADRSEALARAWLDAHVALCRLRDLAPCLLLHATDVIGTDDACCPRFMPGMGRTAAVKQARLAAGLRRYLEHFSFATFAARADRLAGDAGLAERAVDAAPPPR